MISGTAAIVQAAQTLDAVGHVDIEVLALDFAITDTIELDFPLP